MELITCERCLEDLHTLNCHQSADVKRAMMNSRQMKRPKVRDTDVLPVPVTYERHSDTMQDLYERFDWESKTPFVFLRNPKIQETIMECNVETETKQLGKLLILFSQYLWTQVFRNLNFMLDLLHTIHARCLLLTILHLSIL